MSAPNQFDALERLLAEAREHGIQARRRLQILSVVPALALVAVVVIVWLDRDRERSSNAALAKRELLRIESKVEQRHAESAANIAQELRADLDARVTELLSDPTLSDALLSTPDAQARIREQLNAAVDELELRTPPRNDGLSDALSAYETRLDEVAARVDDPETATRLNDLRAQMQGLRSTMSGLNMQMRCALEHSERPRDFLLESRRSNELNGIPIVVALGAVRNNRIDQVAISAASGTDRQVDTRVIAQVPLGSAIRFRFGDEDFEGKFTYAQSRFLNSALVGFELRALPSEECEALMVAR